LAAVHASPVGCPVTVTVKLAVPVLPFLSVAVHLTAVVPIENVEPEAGLHVTGRDP
jgi:hypothetical protein